MGSQIHKEKKEASSRVETRATQKTGQIMTKLGI